MTDPYEQRSISKTDRNCLTYRLYYALSEARRALNPNRKDFEALKEKIDSLVVEYETTKFNAHRNRN